MSDVLFTKDTEPTDGVLKVVALTPTRLLSQIGDRKFYEKLEKKNHQRIAFFMAAKSRLERGNPIGGVDVDAETNMIVGKWHNTMVQENNPFSHGETGTHRDAGRLDYSHIISHTTLYPCDWCKHSFLKVGAKHVVVGDATNVPRANEHILTDAGVKVEIIQDQRSIALYKEFAKTNPALNHEDWLGRAALKKEGYKFAPKAKLTPEGLKLAGGIRIRAGGRILV